MFDTLRDLPPLPGVGYKPQHFAALLDAPGAVGWLEIHAENYMGDGGRPLAQLRALAERFPVSVHGVGLSIGGAAPLDRDHLARLAHLTGWLKPARFSEHLAWSTHDGAFLNDLLPLPYTDATLTRVCDHIERVQEVLGRQMLLIDSHGRAVADPVWVLLDRVLDRAGPRPVLIEWDTDVPDWPVLEAEAARAGRALARAAAKAGGAAPSACGLPPEVFSGPTKTGGLRA